MGSQAGNMNLVPLLVEQHSHGGFLIKDNPNPCGLQLFLSFWSRDSVSDFRAACSGSFSNSCAPLGIPYQFGQQKSGAPNMEPKEDPSCKAPQCRTPNVGLPVYSNYQMGLGWFRELQRVRKPHKLVSPAEGPATVPLWNSGSTAICCFLVG